MCSLAVARVSFLFMYLWPWSGWSCTQTAGNYCGDCFQRNYVQIVLPLAGRSCSRDWHAPPPTKYQMTLTLAHRRLTQPLHGLVQDVGICTGVEVCAGFHGSSAGLRKQRTDSVSKASDSDSSLCLNTFTMCCGKDINDHTKKCRLGLLFFQSSLPTLTTCSAQAHAHKFLLRQLG